MRPSRAVLASLLLCLPLLAQERIRIDVQPPETLHVGQRLDFAVEILTEERFAIGPRFVLPRVPDIIVMQESTRPVFGSTELEGKSYTSYRYDFAAYARRAGETLVPAIQAELSITSGVGQKPRTVRVSTEPFGFKVQSPPGAEGMPGVISSSSFSLEESWEPDPGEAEVGASFRRVIRMRAEAVPGMLLPLVPVPESDGYRVYAEAPELVDRQERGELEGRSESVQVFVCQRPGSFLVPELKVVWFDLDAKQLREERLPERRVVVRAATVSTPTASGRPPLLWGLAALLLAVIGVGSWRLWRTCRRARDRREPSLRAVHEACARNDAGAALSGLLAALDRVAAPGRTPTIEGWAARTGNDELREALAALERAFSLSEEWRGDSLAALLPARLQPAGIHRLREDSSLSVLNPASR